MIRINEFIETEIRGFRVFLKSITLFPREAAQQNTLAHSLEDSACLGSLGTLKLKSNPFSFWKEGRNQTEVLPSGESQLREERNASSASRPLSPAILPEKSEAIGRASVLVKATNG